MCKVRRQLTYSGVIFLIIFSISQLFGSLALAADIVQYVRILTFADAMGDLNSDRAIDMRDLLRLRNIILQQGILPSDSEILKADFSLNGGVDSTDLKLLSNLLLKSSTEIGTDSAEIGSAGGSISFDGGVFELPAGSLDQTELVSVFTAISFEHVLAAIDAYTICDLRKMSPVVVTAAMPSLDSGATCKVSFDLPTSWWALANDTVRPYVFVELVQGNESEEISSFERFETSANELTGTVESTLPWWVFDGIAGVNSQVRFTYGLAAQFEPVPVTQSLAPNADPCGEWQWALPFAPPSSPRQQIVSNYIEAKRCNIPPGSPCNVHKGVDFAVPIGTSVKAMKGGKVFFKDNIDDSRAGKFIVIEHEGGVRTRYLHLSAVWEVGLAIGSIVSAGQEIGLSGNTGVGTGPHLHVEVRKMYPPILPSGGTFDLLPGLSDVINPLPCMDTYLRGWGTWQVEASKEGQNYYPMFGHYMVRYTMETLGSVIFQGPTANAASVLVHGTGDITFEDYATGNDYCTAQWSVAIETPCYTARLDQPNQGMFGHGMALGLHLTLNSACDYSDINQDICNWGWPGSTAVTGSLNWNFHEHEYWVPGSGQCCPVVENYTRYSNGSIRVSTQYNCDVCGQEPDEIHEIQILTRQPEPNMLDLGW